jgi:sulfide:quinone oxidoreductase
MIQENVEQICEQLDQELRKRGLSRRDALKLAGVGTASFLLNPSEVKATTKAVASEVKGKIIIDAGGAAGFSIASQLVRKLSNPDITIIEPNPNSVSYQPGQTLIGAGVWKKDDIMGNSIAYFPSEAKWIKDSVSEFDPDKNKILTKNNGEISYDFLVVATGLLLN